MGVAGIEDYQSVICLSRRSALCPSAVGFLFQKFLQGCGNHPDTTQQLKDVKSGPLSTTYDNHPSSSVFPEQCCWLQLSRCIFGTVLHEVLWNVPDFGSQQHFPVKAKDSNPQHYTAQPIHVEFLLRKKRYFSHLCSYHMPNNKALLQAVEVPQFLKAKTTIIPLGDLQNEISWQLLH